ncbi:MAG: tetratricopeptide repeat protein [Myxococcota bacterium]|jgi:tetratricopeptide (TPR) repeat protein|nr:tetratricopeptide repeat protein [Myxococcota bacterium]
MRWPSFPIEGAIGSKCQWLGTLALSLALLLNVPGCELSPSTPIDPNALTASPEEVIANARQLVKQDRLAEATALLDEHISANPNDAVALSLRGIVRMREGKIYPAVKDLSASAQIAPNADVYFNLGNVMQQGGFFDRAETAYRTALEYSPQDPEILANLASNLVLMDRSSEAISLLERVISARPNDPLAHTLMGMAYHRLQQWSEAENKFLEALRLAPDYYQAAFNLAKTYEAQGKDQLAGQQYKRYLELRPNAPDRGKIQDRINQYLGVGVL